MTPVRSPEREARAAVGRGRRSFDAGCAHAAGRRGPWTLRASSIGLPPIGGEPVSLAVPGDRLTCRSKGDRLPIRCLGDRSPARSNGAIDLTASIQTGPVVSGRQALRLCRDHPLRGMHLLRSRARIYRFLRRGRLPERLAPMGNRAISDERILPVIQAGSERYRPSRDRVRARRREVGAPGFRVGPVLFSVAGLGGFVENNMRTSTIGPLCLAVI
jgi:hypothetical protein